MTTSRPPAPLPIRIRPVAGEGLKSFIGRLAAANHVKAEYLRRYLVDPPWSWSGSPSWERLASVVGRDPSSLKEILTGTRCVECGTLSFKRMNGSTRQTCSHACRQKAYRRRNPKPQKEERRLICQRCGTKLAFGTGAATRRWCSDSCRRKAYRQRRREKAEALPSPELNCGFCDAPLGPGRRRWCSQRCCQAAYRRRRFSIPPRQQPTTCSECASPLEPSRNQIRLTCSAACRTKRHYRRKKGRINQ